ncbi:glucose sorbosone dehydrogenase [Hymenobacter roseosalivarius DSM 11622]|uniref:Glucose sorbosone dehydrogenase n=1 Tax=Hymenobacter roseosalivarius DSM 11622 TaxID=645990 RepID=A0A1W1VHN4_9BACT|nr:PQQ-dependent sugar dehydrogenase [Hymenobacter roseosalivarius]SMB92474.1 glucose sorbosone dehydrogenase [Hymenobacter roseosalivarius DSM 11622]
MKEVLTLALLLAGATLHAQEKKAPVNPPDVVETKSGKVKIEHLATLNEPWGMAWLPDGRLLITEKPGRLRIYSQGKLSEPLRGLPKIEYHGQGGLLDVKIDPDFSRTKLVYFSYTEAADQQPNITRDIGDPRLGKFNDYSDAILKGGAVARGRLEGQEVRNIEVIWRQVPKTVGRGHFGGRLLFAPDGTLFITSGERQRSEPAQDLTSNLGKMIRINPDGSIPKTNPFINKKGVRPEIWSYGHRNPLGAAFNPATKQLWIHEMGALHGDELNIPLAGKNYGWPVVSNGNNYDGSPIPAHETKPEFAAPVYYWHPAISPSGLAFYTGSLFKDWSGNALLGSFNSEALVRLTLDGNNVSSEERIWLQRRIREVLQAPDGSVWLLTDYKDGELLRLSPVADR